MPDSDNPIVHVHEVTKLTKCFAWLKRVQIGDVVCKHQVTGRMAREHVEGYYSTTSAIAIERAAAAYRRQIDEAEAKCRAARERLAWCHSQLATRFVVMKVDDTNPQAIAVFGHPDPSGVTSLIGYEPAEFVIEPLDIVTIIERNQRRECWPITKPLPEFVK
jgi:hypothetical protein